MISTSAMPWARMGIGLLQGFALFLLYHASELKAWPATDGLVFAPLLAVAVFVPLLVLSGLGNLRLRTLIVWTCVATILCAGFAVYDIFRDPTVTTVTETIPRIVPSGVMWFSLAVILFIVHTLTVAGEADRRVMASYPTHFDLAWKHGVQFVLAVAFVAVFWGLLFLSAELFRLIKIEYLAQLIRRQVFWIPVTATAFSYAIHVTDIRANIVQGTRTLALVLLSWLLPLMVLVSVAFVAALPFTGLEPLWATRRATVILLIAAAALIFLVNAVYQDGRAESRAAAVLRYASVVAAVVLLPLIALAAYGLALRISQYGLTPERIYAAACVVVAACYGVGYVIAAGRYGTSFRELERTNLVTSLVIVGVLLMLRSPIADPDRIAVADQVSRLKSGRTSPDQFDFAFLRFRAGRYGTEALDQLVAHAEGPQAAVIAERAAQALRRRSQWEMTQAAPPTTPQQRASNITVIEPKGGTLPDRFLQQDWMAFPRRWLLPRCLLAMEQCNAIVTDLDGDGKSEILLFAVHAGSGAAFKSGTGDSWEFLGTIANLNCPGVRDALTAGRFEMVQDPLKEIEANGQRLYINTECAPSQAGR